MDKNVCIASVVEAAGTDSCGAPKPPAASAAKRTKCEVMVEGIIARLDEQWYGSKKWESVENVEAVVDDLMLNSCGKDRKLTGSKD